MNSDTEYVAGEEAENDTLPTLYTIELEIMVKDFMSQKSGNPKQVYQIHCNTIEEFREMIWSVIQQYIEKPIIYNGESECYEWYREDLVSNDLDRFVLFQDKTSKRTYEVVAVSTKLLQAWKNKKGLFNFTTRNH